MVSYKFQDEVEKADGLKDKRLHTEQLNAYIHPRQLLPPSWDIEDVVFEYY